MFFVAYLFDFDVYIAIPVSWVHDYKKVVERFMHSGLKWSKKEELCFYGEHEDVMDCGEAKIPNRLFEPDFNAALSYNYPCEKGLFICKLESFFGKRV